MSDIKQSASDLIGGTPLLQLNNYSKKAGVKEKPEAPAQAAAPKLQQPVNRGGGVRLSAGQMRQLIRSGKQELENMR